MSTEYASTLKTIRGSFGLRQHELAQWLGLSRSQYSQVEAGLDPLPAHARPWFWPWVAALRELPSPPVAPVPPALDGPPAAGPAELLARLAECRYQARRLHTPLAELRARHATLQARLAAGPTVAASLPPPPAGPGEADALARRLRWLARLLEAATDGLRPEVPAGPTAATLLAARQAAWLYEADWLATHLAAGNAQ